MSLIPIKTEALPVKIKESVQRKLGQKNWPIAYAIIQKPLKDYPLGDQVQFLQQMFNHVYALLDDLARTNSDGNRAEAIQTMIEKLMQYFVNDSKLKDFTKEDVQLAVDKGIKHYFEMRQLNDQREFKKYQKIDLGIIYGWFLKYIEDRRAVKKLIELVSDEAEQKRQELKKYVQKLYYTYNLFDRIVSNYESYKSSNGQVKVQDLGNAMYSMLKKLDYAKFTDQERASMLEKAKADFKNDLANKKLAATTKSERLAITTKMLDLPKEGLHHYTRLVGLNEIFKRWSIEDKTIHANALYRQWWQILFPKEEVDYHTNYKNIKL